MEKNGKAFEFWRDTLGSPKYVVAPMVDASELAWRILSRRYGAQLCYTPMLHSSVFTRDPGYRRDALKTCEGDRPLIIQFCANDPQTLLKAAKLAEDHCDAIDLNLGCPQQIARRGHYGAFLQDEWDLIAEMIKLCAAELKVPITAKIRIFEDVKKTVEYAKMLEKAGCKVLTVHGRTREMKGLDTGLANWDHIKAVRDNITIPMFANGNIQYLTDVHRCLEVTGVQGIMSAEGNLHNPAMFHGIQPPVWKMGLEYLELVKKYPCPMSYIRGHIFKIMLHALGVHKKLREEVGSCKDLAEMHKVVLKVKEESQPDVEKYNNDPDSYKQENGLPFPYWICQPYVRPSAEEREERQKERQKEKQAEKRALEDDNDGVSKNQLKKIKRNQNKLFQRKGRDHYEKCENDCGNIRGMTCIYNWCKTCCRIRCFQEIKDCPGHHTMVKTKLERRLAWEAQQRALAENTNNENIDAQNRASAAAENCEQTIRTDGRNNEQPSRTSATDTAADCSRTNEVNNTIGTDSVNNMTINNSCVSFADSEKG